MSTASPGAGAHPADGQVDGPDEPPAVTVLVYSDDPRTREQVMLALGRRPAQDLGRFQFVEHDSAVAVVADADAGGLDLLILDGEAAPTGGLGVCRQLKNEVFPCPPVLVLTGRRDDRWLAVWSLADATVPHPIDALELVDTVVGLLRSRADRRAALS